MRVLGKILLTILFIPLFFLFLISTTLRFQILNQNFWLNTLQQEGVYENIEVALKEGFMQKAQEESVSTQESLLVSSLITADNIKVFLEENIVNITQFLNGTTQELLVYLPLERLPPQLTRTINLESNEVPIEELTTLLGNSQALNQVPLGLLSDLGLYLTIAWLIIITILVSLTALIYKLVKGGQRLTFPGLTFALSGLLTLVVVAFGSVVRKEMAKDLLQGEPAEILLGTIAPPALSQILQLWMYIGAGFLFFGFLAFFFKKPKTVKK